MEVDYELRKSMYVSAKIYNAIVEHRKKLEEKRKRKVTITESLEDILGRAGI